MIRDYFRDLETFVKKQYFSSVSLRIRKQVKMITEIKGLKNNIAQLNEDCAKLEDELLKKEQKIAEVQQIHSEKMEVALTRMND